MRDLLGEGGVPARLDPDRGYDHGTFSMMKPLYPEEELPIVQLSIDRHYDPAAHLRVGAVLAPLRNEGVLIVGSRLTYHNMSAMRDPASGPVSAAFDAWLQDTLVHSTPKSRADRLLDWESAPMARVAHPEEDHLIPLMVAVGAAGNDAGRTVYHQTDFAGHLTASSFRFG